MWLTGGMTIYEKLYEYLQSYGYMKKNFITIDFYDDNYFIAVLNRKTKMSWDTQIKIQKGFEATYGIKLDILGTLNTRKCDGKEG